MTIVFVGCLQTALAQNTIASIRKAYQEQKEAIALMSDDFPGEGTPPVYYHLHVAQNLPGTGPHHENVHMYYGELPSEEEGDPFPPHYLSFVSSKYNFAAREYYEEYLYDDKGQVMFIYAITPDVMLGELWPYELRMWFDGRRLLRFMAKRYDGQPDYLDIATLRKATWKEEYTGKAIPEKFRQETDRCQQRAQRYLSMFKGIDDNTNLSDGDERQNHRAALALRPSGADGGLGVAASHQRRG